MVSEEEDGAGGLPGEELGVRGVKVHERGS